MEFDAKFFDAMKNMDPDEFNKKISEASAALGVDARMVKMLAGDPDALKSKLEKLNADDLKKISSRLDAEKLAKLKKMF